MAEELSVEAPDVVQVDRPDVISLLLENHRLFLTYLEKKLINRVLARDILQEAFAKVLEQPEFLPGVEGVGFWFYRRVRNAVMDALLRDRQRNHVLELFAREIENRDSHGGRELRREIEASVSRVLATMKPECAALAKSVELENENVKVFAQRAGLTPGTAAVHVFRVRQELKKQVAASFRTCAEFGYVTCNCERGIA